VKVLTHILHTKICEKTYAAVKSRADDAGIGVSAYNRLLLEAHLELPSSIRIIQAGDKVTRQPQEFAIQAYKKPRHYRRANAV
jgi:hypothetical protein